jgi:prophage antirepressor-like protein
MTMNLMTVPEKKQTLTVKELHFDEHAVRYGKYPDGKPWFVGKDVCDCLEIRKSRDAIASLQKDETRPLVVDGKRGERSMTLVNESGLYRLIFRSRKPVAERFRSWVAREVLPSIRKHGIYEGGTAALADRRLTAAAYAELRGIQGTTNNGVSQRARHLCILTETEATACHRGKLYPVHILDRACECLIARTGALCGGPATVQLELL